VKTASGNDYGLTNTSFRVGQRVTATEATTLTFGDGSVIRLDKGTSFEVDRCNDNQPSDPTVLELLIGKLWRAAKSAATGGQTFQVETQRAGTGVRGTTFWISYLPAKKQTTLHVVKGSVEMWRRSTPKRKLLVKTGQTAVQQGSALPRITKR